MRNGLAIYKYGKIKPKLSENSNYNCVLWEDEGRDSMIFTLQVKGDEVVIKWTS